MPNVLFDIHYPIFGGPHNQALQIAKPLKEAGWNLSVLLPDEPGNARSRLEEAGVRVILVPLRRIRATKDPRIHLEFLRYLPNEISRIRTIIRNNEIDLVLIGGLYTVQTAIAARLEHKPVVWQILDTLTPPAVRRSFMVFVRLFADSVMTTGLKVAQQHPGATKFGDRLVPYFPPVETVHFRPKPEMRAQARSVLGVPRDALLIGTVGNLNRTKGHQHFIDVAALLADRYPRTYFRILGAYTPTHKAYAEEIKSKAESEESLENGRIAILDPGTNVAGLLPAFDIYASTSIPLSEGIPTTILEAMSAGLPVVSTNVGGVEEAIEDGVSGFLVPPQDIPAMYRSIQQLLDDEALRGNMGSKARQRAVENFDVQSCTKVHIRAFEAAIDHAARKNARD